MFDYISLAFQQMTIKRRQNVLNECFITAESVRGRETVESTTDKLRLTYLLNILLFAILQFLVFSSDQRLRNYIRVLCASVSHESYFRTPKGNK